MSTDLKRFIPNCKAKKTRVVAKLTTRCGRVFYGVNVESSSHSLSSCAERTAIFVAVSSIGPNFVIKEVEVYAERGDEVLDIVPCGGCRQVISEYSDSETVVCGKLIDYWIPNPYR